jgi:hypothetical protein
MNGAIGHLYVDMRQAELRRDASEARLATEATRRATGGAKGLPRITAIRFAGPTPAPSR